MKLRKAFEQGREKVRYECQEYSQATSLGGLVVKTLRFLCRGVGLSPSRELKSCMPHGATKKLKVSFEKLPDKIQAAQLGLSFR